MSLTTLLTRAALSEQRLWRSTCTIDRPAGGGDIFDPSQGSYLTPARANVYTGACQTRLLRKDRDAEAMLGDTAVGVGLYLVKVPLEVAVLRDDLVTILTSSDPAVLGHVLLVKDAHYSEWTPVRRLVCEELRT